MTSNLRMVCIGDLHAHPNYDNKRFGIIGQFCAEYQPDVIVQIGDWPDVSSINKHASKLELETARWKEDVECTNDSIADFERPIRTRKKKMPYRVITMGNHGYRIEEMVAQNPALEGTIGFQQFDFTKRGWEVVPFLQYKEVAGFHFVHYMQGRTGRPLALRTNYIKFGASVVVGHSHLADHNTHRFVNRRIHGIDLGCLIHPSMGFQEAWSNPTCHEYWRGIWTFENALNGNADISMIRAETLGA